MVKLCLIALECRQQVNPLLQRILSLPLLPYSVATADERSALAVLSSQVREKREEKDHRRYAPSPFSPLSGGGFHNPWSNGGGEPPFPSPSPPPWDCRQNGPTPLPPKTKKKWGSDRGKWMISLSQQRLFAEKGRDCLKKVWRFFCFSSMEIGDWAS